MQRIEGHVPIDFDRIQGPAVSDSSNFEKLCAQLIALEFPSSRAVDGRGGDHGVDAFVGNLTGTGEPDVAFQFKFFIETLTPGRRKQIEESLSSALGRYRLKRWTLCIPKVFTPAEHAWWERIASTNPLIEIQLWDETVLVKLLLKYPAVREEFFPDRFTEAQERQLRDLVQDRGLGAAERTKRQRLGVRWRFAAIVAVGLAVILFPVFWFRSDTYQIQQIFAHAPVAEAIKLDTYGDSAGRWQATTILYGDPASLPASLDNASVRGKPLTLARLAAASAEVGSLGDAARFTQETLRATSQWPADGHRLESLADVAVLLGRAGQTDIANKLAHDVVSQADALPAVFGDTHGLPNLEAISRFDSIARAVHAMEIVGNIREARAVAFSHLGLNASNLDMDESLSIAQPHRLFDLLSQTGSPYYKQTLHGITARALSELGDFDRAVQEAEQISYTSYREAILSEVSVSMANAGLVEKAITIEGEGIVPRLAIAVALSRTGQHTRALTQWNDAYSRIKDIQDASPRDFMLSKAAMALAQMNQLRLARKTADQCTDPIARLDAYTVILAEYTKKKHTNLSGAIDAIVFYPDDFAPAPP